MIESRGPHLVFSKGGIRTDRCSSPNPRLKTVSQQQTGTSWKRVCQTPVGDPRFERGEYRLLARSETKLQYNAISKFDWSLKEDHCVARSEEQRIYVRRAPAPEEEAPGDEDGKEDDGEGDEDKGVDTGEEEVDVAECEGEPRRIGVVPRSARLGPGEKACFRAVGYFADGCRQNVDATWTVKQDGHPIQGLLSAGGCFRAGDTAAESEGLYVVSGRFGGHSDTAEVIVVFQDFSELLGARLRPLDDLDEGEEEKAREEPEAPVPAEPTPPTPAPQEGAEAQGPAAGDGGGFPIWLILVFLGVALAGFVVVIVMSLRKRSTPEPWEDDTLEPPPPGPRRGRSRDEAASSERVCPACGERFPPDAAFCPNDGSSLRAASAEEGSDGAESGERDAGMVCPRCHRGYDAGARFCPHDSAELVPYAEWRRSHRTIQLKR
jgi:hypothetical protein